MPSSRERKACGERLRQLERLGLLLSFEHQLLSSQPSDVFVEQCGLGIESPVLDLSDGRTLYLVWLSLVAERPGTCLFDYRFVPPWPDRGFQSLPSFADSHIGEAYVLPGKWDYPREDVLNLRFGKTGWWLPSTSVEGVLCALSGTPIPKEFKHGASIPVGIKFYGRSGQERGATSVVLWADRWREPAVTRRTAKPPVAVDVADSVVATLPRRSTLYDEAGGTYLRTANTLPEKAAPLAARVQVDSPRAGVHGE
jgi:hypothetical protein